jgi:hypothetical protein
MRTKEEILEEIKKYKEYVLVWMEDNCDRNMEIMVCQRIIDELNWVLQ